MQTKRNRSKKELLKERIRGENVGFTSAAENKDIFLKKWHDHLVKRDMRVPSHLKETIENMEKE